MRNRYLLLLDLPLIAIAAFGAFALRFEWLVWNERAEFLFFTVAALLVKPVVLFVFGMYSRYWRYATSHDLLTLTLAASASSVVLAVLLTAALAFGAIESFSRPVLAIDWLLSLALLGGVRMAFRLMAETQPRRRADRATSRRVLIVGAGYAGTMVARELQRNPQLGMEPVGFLDDNPEKHGKWINGVRVLGPLTRLRDCVAIHKVDEVIVAMPAVGGAVVRAVAETCRAAGVLSRTVPGVFELLGGDVSVSRLRTVQITDLLRREDLVGSGRHEAAAYLQRAVVLVTGAGGSIGQEICRQVAHSRPARLVLLGHGENAIFDVERQVRADYPDVEVSSVVADIRDERRVGWVFEQWRPQVVFHAAAHKHVPLMEQNPVEAVSNNVLGTYTVAAAAVRHGVTRFVLISTDKAVAPSSIMGASKRMAERVVQELARRLQGSTRFIVVRFGNVLGSRGSVVPLFQQQIEQGGPVTVTHRDMKRFFMTIPEAVFLVLRAGGLGSGGELFVLNMGQPVRISDLAEDLIRLSGFSPSEIPIVYTGVRAGEKLEEALWEEGAVVHPTAEPEILRVTEPATDTPLPVDAMLDRLRRAVDAHDRLAIDAILAEAIGSFVPSYPKL
jgi:FlaA1/EpsC-like NDP-sugar epimerase